MNTFNAYSAFITIVTILNQLLISDALQCMDQNNDPIDWFVIYKLPKQPSHSNKFVKEGLGYVYMTSNSVGNLTFSNLPITSNESLAAYTLKPLFNKLNEETDLLYILYNNEPPYRSSDATKGHTKGVVMTDTVQGFWLIHSVPHFPHSLETYEYPETGVHYGQSFLCISLNISNLNVAGLQLQYNEPHIFAVQSSDFFKTSSPDLYKAAFNTTIKSPPWYNVAHIQSSSGVEFTSFAKSRKFNKDLYSDLVNVQLESNLDVETWPNEPDRLPSECNKIYRVNNIESISILQANVTFKSTVDHSKFAVSAARDKESWTCIGDINRAKPQLSRGGGTTCLNNPLLTSFYQNAIKTLESCNETQIFVNSI